MVSHDIIAKFYLSIIGMSRQSIEASAYMKGAPQPEQLFPVEREYARCVTALNRTVQAIGFAPGVGVGPLS
jgi:hypothetical protein